MTFALPYLSRWHIRSTALPALLFQLLLPPMVAMAQPRTEDPVPIQRIDLPVERIPAEMENVRRNVLKQMAHSDFENLVRQAAAAREAEREPPRLVASTYRAVLQGDSLIGSAEWKIVHRANGPGRLSLQAMQLALRTARWPDNQPARLGFLEDRPNAPLELWIEKPGEHALTLEWSARGIPQPGGWRFDLRVPACPVLALELDLPAGDILLADGDGIRISGPLLAATSNRSLWHVSLAGVSTNSQLQLPFLVIRPAEAGQPGPLIRYSLSAVQKVLASEAECDFDIDLSVSRGGIRQFSVELDPGLKPRDVLVANLEGWDTQPGPAGSTQLLVRMREPLVGGKVTIRALSALPGADMPWSSPSVRVQGGISRGESLQLRIHPAWQIQDWKSGRFRLANVQTGGDQSQVLTLQESGFGPESPARPEAKLRPVQSVFDLHQNIDWRLSLDAMSLVVQLSCQVRRGLVFELPIVFSSAWELEQVESPRSDIGLRRRVQPNSGPGQSTIHLEFHQPLSAGFDKARDSAAGAFPLTLRFRAPPPRPQPASEGTPLTIPFPQVQVLGAQQRDERLSIRLGNAFFGSAITDAMGAAWNSADWPGAAGASRPDLYFAAQGRSLEGTLQLRSRRSRFQARCDTEATILGTHWRLVHRLELVPRNGSLQEVLVSFSAPLPTDPKAQLSNHEAEVRFWEPLPVDAVHRWISALATPSLWNALTTAQAPTTVPATCWRLVLNRPVQEPLTLEVSCYGVVDDGLQLPLLLVPNADVFEGRVLVQASAARHWDIMPVGLQEVQVDAYSPEAFAADGLRREFRYRSAAALSLRPAGPSQPEFARCEQANLFLQPRSNERLLAAFNFTALGWEETHLPLTLPNGARLIAARLNGQDVLLPVTENSSIVLPWMPFRGWNRGEIVYELPLTRNWLAEMWDAPSPTLPFDANVHRYWDLPPCLVPVNAYSDWQLLPKNAVTFPSSLSDPSNVWEARPGHERSVLTAVRPLFVREIGLLLALLVAGATAVTLGKNPQRKNAFLIAILVMSCLGWIWLPSSLEELATWPLLVVGLIILVRVVGNPTRRVAKVPASGSAVRASTSAVASSVILLFLPAFTVSSAPPAPTPVYLLAAPPGKPEAASVLAPPELIDQLQALCRRATPTGAMLLQARYEGRISEDVVSFEAHYQIHSWTEERTVLQLPLSGIQLRQALLDGAEAWPRSMGQERLAIEITGSGSHLLTLRFAVPFNGTNEREARFGVPELPVNKLTVSAPVGTTGLQALSWKGAQHSKMQPEPNLEADLGRVQTVHLLWQVSGNAVSSAPIQVQEVHLWDLSESTERLQSVFRYGVGGQSLSAFEIDVPPELEVVQANVRAIDNRAASPGQPGLKNWRWETQGSKRRLHLELPFPLTGQVQLYLELLSRQPMQRNPVLGVPVAAGSVERQTFLAYRLQNVQANVLESRGWERISEDSFWLKTWLPLRAEPRSGRPAQAFVRERDALGAIRLALVPPAAKGHGEQRMTWTVGPGRVELSAVGRWFDVPVPGLLQWEVPAGIHVDEVRAPNLRSWSRTGSRLQIWLDSADQTPAEQGIVVQLNGWLARPAAEAEQEKTPFVVPNLWLHDLADQTFLVQVGPRDGWRLLPQEVRGYLPTPDTDLPGYRWSALAAAPDTRAVFRLLPSTGTAVGNILTSVEANNRQLQLLSWIDLSVPTAGISTVPNSVVLELRRGVGWTPQLDLPAGCRLRETRADPGITQWTLDLLPGRHLVRLSSRRTLNSTDDVSIPAITVRSIHGPPAMVRGWIAIAGRDLEPLASTGLAASSVNDLPDTVPSRGRSFSQIWRITQEDWRLRVQPSVSASAKPQVLSELQAAVDPSGGWLQEARYWLFQQSEAEWIVAMPDNALLMSSRLDGREFIFGGSTGQFTTKPGLHFLRLVWKPGSTIADPEPRFEMPRLQFGRQAVSDTPVSSTIRLPMGFGLVAHVSAPRISPAAKGMCQAAAEMAFLRSISSQVPAESLQQLQRDMDLNLSLAEENLNQHAAGFGVETGPNGQPLSSWLRQLREQIPAQASAAHDSQNERPYAAVFDQGEVYCWQGFPDKAGEIRVGPSGTGLLWRWLATAALGIILVLGLWLQKPAAR
jgi:hypothetical protein